MWLISTHCVHVYIYRILLFDFFLNFGQNILFRATCVQPVKHEWQGSSSVRYLFDSECPNVTQIWQLLIDYVYPIITDIWLWFSVQLPIIYVWHCHSLYAALSINVGAWGMRACSLFLSFPMILLQLSDITVVETHLL